jgi:DNA-binding response OmpR family regulator
MPQRARILVVEDDPSIQKVFECQLLAANYEVFLADDGHEGLQRTRELKPDFVLCDWVMPRLDGVQYCRSVKSDPSLRETYVALISSRNTTDDRVAGLDAGADDFLAKPWDIEELMARVRAGVRLRRLQDELRKAEHQAALVEMATTLGHEINNPLTALFGHMELLLQYVEQGNSARTDHHLREAGNVAGRIAEVVQRLIRLSEPETKKYLGDLRMVDLD